MTALVQAEVDGERLDPAEIAAFFVLLSVAGNDTSRHTTSHAMRALTQHPDQRALLLEDLEERMPVAVEEFVRWATPVLTFRRTATRAVELHGERIEPGEKVVLFYHSANRDEEAFEDPWRFDVTRDPNRHVGFGGGGPHYCLGASLARTQLRAIFAELLTRLPDIEVGEPEPLAGAFIHGVKRMDCSWGFNGLARLTKRPTATAQKTGFERASASDATYKLTRCGLPLPSQKCRYNIEATRRWRLGLPRCGRPGRSFASRSPRSATSATRCSGWGA